MGSEDSDSANPNPTGNEKPKSQTDLLKILLYVPNIIGYIRLFLLMLAYFQWKNPYVFMPLYLISSGLDFFDGWAARTFKQCSSFGAWLDVIIDNLSRGLLWANLFQWGWLLVSLEWITFVGNHYEGGAKWREVSDKSPPPFFVQKVMEKGFKTPIGTWAIAGLHILPIWIYGMQTSYFYPYITRHFSITICVILVGGRLLCLACELWCIKKHIKSLLMQDVVQSNKSLSSNPDTSSASTKDKEL